MEQGDNSEKDSKEEKIPIKKQSFNKMIIVVIIAVGVSAFFAGSYFSMQDSDYVTQKDLKDAMAKLELRVMQNQLPSQEPRQPVKISSGDDPVRGSSDAPITIIEFSDFQCPFCARFHAETLPLLLENYIDTGKVKFIYRDYPIQGSHPNAVPAAVAAECADEQGKYWEFHDKLFESQSQWNRIETIDAVSVFSQYASEMELNMEQFDTCLTTGKYIDEVREDLNDGQSYGVSGTPGFFIGNDELGFVELKGAQPFENFQKIIDAQLNSLEK